MKTIHSDNLRVWSGVDAFSTIPGWGDITKKSDGTFELTFEAEENLRKQTAALAWEGINGKRMLPYAGWLKVGMQAPEDCFTPFVFENGKWDLDKRNPQYWPIVKRFVEIYREFNVEMIYTLFDNCQFWHNPAWACWANNHQGIQNYMQDIFRSCLFAQEAMEQLGQFDNVLFAVGNELVEWGGMENSKTWWKAIVQTLKNFGLTADRLVVGVLLERKPYIGDLQFSGGQLYFQEWTKYLAEEVYGEQTAWGIILPVHGVTGDVGKWGVSGDVILQDAPELIYGQMYHEPIWFWGGSSTPRKFYLSNDGNRDKDSPEARAVWKAMVANTIQNVPMIHPAIGHKFIFELECDGDFDVRIAGVKSMMEAIPTGLLVNWHKKEYVPNECRVGMVKKETCWDGSEIITHVCKDGKYQATGATCPVKPKPEPPITWQGWLLLILIVAVLIVLAILIF